MDFADANDGWAVGYDSNTTESVILATTNGGATWSQQAAYTSDTDLDAVHFANASEGWAVGGNENGSLVLVTANGGATWTQQSSGVMDNTLTGVAFANANDGWAVSDGGDIVATTDGGLVTPKLTLTLSGLKRDALKFGRSVTMKGRVAPTALAGGTVTLTVQREHGRRWVTVTSLSATIGANGAYSASYTRAKESSYRIQATIAQTATNTAAATSWLTFTVK